MKPLFFTLLILLLFSACEQTEDNVVFDEPQPATLKNETVFSKRFQGTYKKTIFYRKNINIEFLSHKIDTGFSINTTLDISSDKILETTITNMKIHRNELKDSLTQNESDKEIIGLCMKEGWNNASFRGDTLWVSKQWTETVFSLSEENVLRFFKNSYFLNLKKENSWKMKRLTLKSGQLVLSHPYLTDSLLAEFKKITPIDAVANDSGKAENYKLNPEKKELKKLIRNDFFTPESLYEKIKD